MASMLLATSCSQEEVLSQSTGNEVAVSFTTELRSDVKSRAVGNDTDHIDQLQFAVYQNGKVLPLLNQTITEFEEGENGTKKATIEVVLVKGQTYDFAFWAQDKDYKAYSFDPKTAEVTIDYDKVKANTRSGDAFFAHVTDHTVTGTFSKEITLKRPFAQVNFLTTKEDILDAQNAEFYPSQSTIKVENVATSLNVLTGGVDGNAKQTFAMNGILREQSAFASTSIKGVEGTYYYLATAYILPTLATGTDKINATMSVDGRTGTDVTLVAENINAERNYRTNIYGKLLTDNGKFNVTVDPGFEETETNFPGTDAEKLAFAAKNGGTVNLTDNVELPQTLIVADDISMVINLNGYNIINTSNSTELEKGDGIIVYGNLEINGPGTIQGNTRAIWARGDYGARVRINGGDYIGCSIEGANSEVIYASGNGVIDIYGGTFEAKHTSSAFASPQYAVLNLHGNGKDGCKINVYGGTFKKFNPADNISENPKQNFVAEGYSTILENDNYLVVSDIILYENYADVYTAKGLLKWAYIVKDNNSYSVNIKKNIVMPAFTIEEDADNKTYKFTANEITVTDGTPSGYNWIPLCTVVSVESDGYNGTIEGENHSISGLYIKNNRNYTGLVGFMYNGGSVKNLIIENSSIAGTGSVGAVVGRAQHNTLVENVKVNNSKISGNGSVGGIVGVNYSRNIKADGTVFGEELAIIKNCTTDNNSSINGTGAEVGGICGTNNGGAVINCTNNADVIGNTNVGGVAGVNRPYNTGREGYVIACGSTADATIHATNQYAGGIVGNAFKDVKQVNTVGYIVACYSCSNVTGKNNATMAGYSTNGTVTASWAAKNGVESYARFSKGGSFTRNASEHFASASEITEDFVNEMNAAIENYNANSVEVQCEYRWALTNGNWPILQ